MKLVRLLRPKGNGQHERDGGTLELWCQRASRMEPGDDLGILGHSQEVFHLLMGVLEGDGAPGSVRKQLVLLEGPLQVAVLEEEDGEFGAALGPVATVGPQTEGASGRSRAFLSESLLSLSVCSSIAPFLSSFEGANRPLRRIEGPGFELFPMAGLLSVFLGAIARSGP